MIDRSRRKGSARRTLGFVAAASTVIALSLSGVSTASAADRVSYPGSVPSWAKNANDVGATTPAKDVEGEIYLSLRDAAGAAALATAVSTPGSRSYRRYLEPQQWIARYSPTKPTLDAVVKALTDLGLRVTDVPDSRLFVVFRGSAAQVGAAFATSLHNYSYSGAVLSAPSSVPSIPTSIGSMVSGVSIDQSKSLTRPTSVTPEDGIAAAEAQSSARKSVAPSAPPAPTSTCSHYAGQNTTTMPEAYGTTQFGTYICGYVPAQLRSAYGLDSLAKSGVNGAGQTVAIIDAYASPTIVQDANTYSAQLGEPGLTSANYSQIVPKPSEFRDQEACGFPSGWQGEQTLDVEAVHGVATGAKILYVGAFNCIGGIDMALSNVIDNKRANIVSNSYGNPGEALPLDAILGEQNIFIQAASEGIGLYFSSGDSGDEVANVGYPSPDFPASSPYVTSVGGTSLGIDQSGKIAWETGWGSTLDQVNKTKTAYLEPLPGTFRFGAGGGRSAVFAEPDYQKGVVPAALSKGYRVSPDISAVADPYTGFLIGLRPIVDETTLATGDFITEGIGGTSLAAPVTAAQIAIVQQATRTSIGFANPTLYGLDRILPFAFRDVKPASTVKALAITRASTGNTYLISLDKDSSLATTAGYDDVTGIGGVTFGLLSLLAAGRH